VKNPSPFSACRIVGVAILLMGWFVLTNHCALGMMRTSPEVKAQHSCCHRGSPPPSEQAPEVPQQCCKDIKAALSAADWKVPVPAEDTVFPVVLLAVDEPLHAEELASQEHGPPATAWSFAEVVLQRSLPSHAPPFLL
jgi:hypothetical protein